jgi:hypothetical protein
MQPETAAPDLGTSAPSDAYPLGDPPDPDRLDRHAVRDLASSVLGYAELLGELAGLSGRGRRHLDHISSSARALLRQAEHRLDRHAVRDLASSVLGYAELLGELAELSGRGRRHLDHISSSARALLRQAERREPAPSQSGREI